MVNDSGQKSQSLDSLLTEENKKELENQLKQIEQKNLNDEEKAIEFSLLYAEYSLLDEAIEEIEKPALAESQNPQLHWILGDLLSIQKKYSLAIKSYEKVIELASNSKDLNFQEMSIIAQMELANCWGEKAQQESASLPKMGKRLTELVNKQQSLLAARSNDCPCDPPGVATAGKWEWINGEEKCVACSISG